MSRYGNYLRAKAMKRRAEEERKKKRRVKVEVKKKCFVYDPSCYKDECKDKVKEILIDKLGVSEYDVKNDNAHLIYDLGCDSLDVVELAMELENEFNIRIPDEEIENKDEKCFTISYVVEVVKKHLNDPVISIDKFNLGSQTSFIW
jgi:acyl carrier protein